MNNKIQLSVELLKEVIVSFPESKERKEAEDNLIALQNFLKDNFFNNQKKEDKENISYKILTDTIELCLPYLYHQFDILNNNIPKKCSDEKARSILIKEYNDKKTWEDVAAMNINEWIESKNIVLSNKKKKKEKNCSEKHQ